MLLDIVGIPRSAFLDSDENARHRPRSDHRYEDAASYDTPLAAVGKPLDFVSFFDSWSRVSGSYWQLLDTPIGR